jgi:8-oxo-dGTP pyrophosphatase MutT (NUDIX family)
MASRTLLGMRIGAAARPVRTGSDSKKRQQVAAVCYRMTKRGIEFLLVQTRGGRWIFPKGGVEPGLTYAQSAALEAREEAGVHGRIEEIPFARYFRRGSDFEVSGGVKERGIEESGLAVGAYLCEVSRLETPHEANRHPTWFSAERAKQRLIKDRDRTPEFGVELARIIDRAVSRIRRLHGEIDRRDRVPVDGLRRVRFEAAEYRLGAGLAHDDRREAAATRYFLRGLRSPARQLGTGIESDSGGARNVTSIERGRGVQNNLRRKS